MKVRQNRQCEMEEKPYHELNGVKNIQVKQRTEVMSEECQEESNEVLSK
jgi:hypothetical protein